MTAKAKKIRAFFQKQAKGARHYLKSLDKKRRESKTFAWWMEWHAMDYIHWELVAHYWETLLESLDKLVGEGKTDAEIIKWIEDCRERFIRDILQATAQYSTNQLANMMEADRVDVWRRITGANNLNGDSLMYLLSSLKRN
jgi:hypothetical protein